jgi:hypothetical protein
MHRDCCRAARERAVIEVAGGAGGFADTDRGAVAAAASLKRVGTVHAARLKAHAVSFAVQAGAR